MRHLELFSGIGGFALAASWVWGKEHEIHSFVEIDPFCQKVLKKHWPNVPIVSDIKEYRHDGTTIDLLTGGFPCQPFSVAGKQRGTEDDRWRWPEMFKVISEVKPRWIIGENVAGIVKMELDNCISDLEAEGYECQPFIIPACAVDAPHRRDRVWIVAYSTRGREKPRTEWRALDKPGEAGVMDNPECSRHMEQSREITAKQNSNREEDRLLKQGSQDVPNPKRQHDDRTRHGSSSVCGERSR